MSKGLKILIGVAVSVLCLRVVFRGFDPNQLKLALQTASYVWLIPFFALYIFNQTIRTWRWQTLLSPIVSTSVPVLFPVLVVGFFMNIVLPARGGEFVRAYAAHRRLNINPVSAFGSIVADRFSDFIGLLLIVLLACTVLPIDKLPVVKIGMVLIIGAAGLAIAILLFKKADRENQPMTGIKKVVFDFFKRSIQGFMALKSPKAIAMVALMSMAVWLNETLMVLTIAKMMNFPLTFFQCCAVIVGLSVGVMIPAAPGYIGTFEFFGKQILVLLGFAAAESLNVILVLHFMQVIAVSVVGATCLLFLKKDHVEIAYEPN